jgi:hypothetical protein
MVYPVEDATAGEPEVDEREVDAHHINLEPGRDPGHTETCSSIGLQS